MSKKTVIYILPHYDDEIFVIPKIECDLKNKCNVIFFYLMKSSLRLQESIKFLTSLGVTKQNIYSLGELLNIQDGSVHLSLATLFQELISQLKQFGPIIEFVCTSFEGGHHDHDATSILTRVLAKKLNSKVSEFSLYNGYGTRGKFYNVASPRNIKKNVKIHYSASNYLSLLCVPFVYRSQVKAMLGLLPLLFFKSLFNPLTLNQLEYDQLDFGEHKESPLYERWKRISLQEFQIAQSDFLKTLN
jgi:hypothetical protein